MTNVMPMRPQFEEHVTQAAGELGTARTGIGSVLAGLSAGQQSQTVGLCLGAVEVGRIDVADGVVVHAEVPGATGDVALRLSAKLAGIRTVLRDGEPCGQRTVTIDWRTVFEVTHDDAPPPPNAGSSTASAHLEPIAADPEQDYEGLFRAATAAYIQRDYARALELFEQCHAARPQDRRVAHNLDRLRTRQGGGR